MFFEFKNVKLTGICFGHQVISSALGGKVERMTDYLQSVGLPLFQGKEHLLFKNP